MSAEGTGLEETLLPPAYPITDRDRGGYVLLTAVIMFVLTGLTVGTKLQMTLSTFGKFRREDVAMVVALCFDLGYTVTICRAVNWGLGRSGDLLTASQYYYAANILLWPSIAASKCTVAFLILALQPPRQWIKLALYVVLGVSATWGVAASFIVAFQCGPTRYVLGPTSNDSCIDQWSAQLVLRLLDIATDIALCVLPGVMMMYVQINLTKKLMVSGMFALRLITPIFTAVALSTLPAYYDHLTPERPFAAVLPSIWTSMAINTSLATACLPAIRRVLGGWAAGLSNANILEPFELQHSSNLATSRIAGGSATGGGWASHSQSHTRSRAERAKRPGEDDGNYAYYLRERKGGAESDDAESKKGLTDGISRTVDYSVEYEHEGADERGFGHGVAR